MPSFYRRILLFFGIVMLAGSSFAQQQIFKIYGMNDGLVHNSVRKIYQDSKGFLWIGTWEGLSKYDGHRFTNYAATNGLSIDFVNDIFEANTGSVYITCNDGGIYRINNNDLPQKINETNVVVNKLVQLSPNKIVALTDVHGIQEFTDGKLFKPAQYGASNDYFTLISLNDSLLVAQSDSSLQILDRRYRLFSLQRENTPLYGECAMLKDSKNRVWVGTRQGLKLLSPLQKKGGPVRFLNLPPAFHHELLQKAWISAILEDDAGNLWFGTAEGLLKVAADGLSQLITEKNGLPANDVTCLFQDREKNIWAGGSRGVAKLPTANSIRIFRTEDGLLSNNIFHLLPFSNGDVLTVSVSGMQLYKKSTGKFEPAANNFYENESNQCLSIQHSGLPQHTLIFQQAPTHFTFFSPTPIGGYYVFKDSSGYYFNHSHSGVLFSNDLKNWKPVLYGSDTRVLLLDTKGVLWVGTRDSGLLRIVYQYKDGVPQVKEQTLFLQGVGIRSLYEDSKGAIWAGSRYNGLFLLQQENGRFRVQQFNQKSGLTSNRITSIAEDKKGAIWASFYSGLDKLVPENNTYRVFNFSRFHNFFTNIQTMVVDRQHSLWLGTTQGLVNIIDGETEKTSPSKTFITSAVLGDSTYTRMDGETIILSHNQTSVHFGYAAPAFSNEKQVMYSYRLLGGQTSEWSLPSNEHAVSFANLRPGDYRFEVRTLGWNNQWGEAAVFAFSIHPPFWLTWWFISAAVLGVAVVVFFVIRKRIRNIRRQAELKHKLSDAEMIALRSQMNPHFIFNCLSAIDNLIQTNQPDKATTYLSRFAKLMRSVLESSKNNLVPFEKDFETLNLYLQLEQFRCSNKFSYELNADRELLEGDYRVPPLIVQPFIENAIQHGLLNKQQGEKKLWIKASLKNNHIHYTITDNGVGRTKAYEIKTLNRPDHSSYGIQITAERIHLHNQNGKTNDLQIIDLVEEGMPSGTRVEVQLKTDH